MMPSSATDVMADSSGNGDQQAQGTAPKAAKRLACMVCRKRKLKCDGVRPSCSTCSRLGHTCAYNEVRRKSGPKRGYVKALESRLREVEKMLKTQDTNDDKTLTADANVASSRDMDRWRFTGESPTLDGFDFSLPMDTAFSWEMVGLGLEEPLPPQDVVDELHAIYFEKVHPSVPMMHRFRYLAAMHLAPHQRPPVCLRYAVWTLGASTTDRFADLRDVLYARARRYLEADYVKGYGENVTSVAHAQTHVLLASYEFKMMYFPRAWMSTGAAVRLCQMLGLHRVDGSTDVKQCLPPARDWTEKEERRRTFWMAFCQDRYASIGTCWPMTCDERDIATDMPASEEAFEASRPETTRPLADAVAPGGAALLSPFGGIVVLACLFGRNLLHLHRPDAAGDFWKRHRALDALLVNTWLCLPPYLKLPQGLACPNVVFTNMCIHAATICLHQAATLNADKDRLAHVSSECKARCITAANEITSIMRMISHMDLTAMNAFLGFCLFVASRVFVQYLKSRPNDGPTADSLRFLLQAMTVLKTRNPLTESFLLQLDVDLEALGSRIPQLCSAFPRSTDVPGPKTHVPTMMKDAEPCIGLTESFPLGTPVGPTSLPLRRRPDSIPLHGAMPPGAGLTTYGDMKTESSTNGTSPDGRDGSIGDSDWHSLLHQRSFETTTSPDAPGSAGHAPAYFPDPSMFGTHQPRFVDHGLVDAPAPAMPPWPTGVGTEGVLGSMMVMGPMDPGWENDV